ncbi:RloB family protein [Lentzea sp. NPDC059081]|uniref:RloB family protein n=1 Tax=Lentzea sp. NPDC059081 TaxID=3346719 RepID=UPI003677B50C
MAKREKKRENSQSRLGRPRELRPGHVLIATGGRCTEPAYFNGLARARGARVKVRQKTDSPENLVRYAKSIYTKDEYDSVWCVVDVDDFDIMAARVEAARQGVELAVSEPCFEVWLLLHFIDHRAHVDNGKAACKLLAKHVPAYDKKLDYAAFEGGVDMAVKRAKELPAGNPSTDVWRLVEVLLRH